MQISQALLAYFAVPALGSVLPLEDRQTSGSACSAAEISASRAAQVRAAFQSSRVAPDVVPDIRPSVDFAVRYGSKQMNLGTTYGVAETLMEPKYSFAPESGYDPSTTKYTVVIADPDAPGPELPLLRQYIHLITYDVQPACIVDQSPKTLAPYVPLTPLSVSPHRYTYLLYRQPPGDFQPAISPIDFVARAPFDLQGFVNKYNLTLVGGNFMREGLSSLLVGVVPFATQDGTGYKGPLDGTAEPADGIKNLLS